MYLCLVHSENDHELRCPCFKTKDQGDETTGSGYRESRSLVLHGDGWPDNHAGIRPSPSGFAGHSGGAGGLIVGLAA